MATTKKNKAKQAKKSGKADSNLNKYKMEAAKEVGVSLKQGSNAHLTSKQAGSIGGQMVKKMVEQAKTGNK